MRIIIAEDAAILRDGLAQLLRLRGHEVTCVADGDALLAAEASAGPAYDVAVIDIRMPPTHTDEGLRAAVALRERRPELGLLMFSQYVETRYVDELLRTGVAGTGYLLKERVVELDEFLDALERIANGGTALDPEVVAQLFGSGRARRDLETLTPREREVLALMAEGRSNAAIAAASTVTERAVEKHVANIFQKLRLPPSGSENRRVLAVLRYLGV
jgi:DNA-binding NarL/FixJ family response regulator